MSALSARLDELEALRAKAEGLPWHVDPPQSPRVADMDSHVVAATDATADAALIVAAVNAVPQLVAALRAVERRMQDWDVMARELHHVPVAEAYADVVIGLRDALALDSQTGATR